MEKKYKPVPDVECLKYHGTPEKPDIKIFVSHRIDLDSETIDNPLYIPVRCGAVYDDREGITMLGDDTGDNISEKRESFCELTVQYWAWKNVKADYYGMCHYRRFYSFSDIQFPAGWQEIVHEKKLGQATIQKHNLYDHEMMTKEISSCDALIHHEFSLAQYPGEAVENPSRTVYQYWRDLDNICIDYQSIEIMLDVLCDKYPEYYNVAKQYLDGHSFLGYNCFILKKELFFDLCEFEFNVLFEVEKKIDTTYYTTRKKRTLAYLAEILYSIWVYRTFTLGSKYSWKTKQLVMFDNTDIEDDVPYFGSKTIPIVVMSSRLYAAFSAPFLRSLLDCAANSENCYEVIYLHHEISDQDKKKLAGMAKGYENIKVKFINPEGLIDTSKFNVAEQYYAAEAYYRLFAPWILKKYTRILVMDVDIIIKRDPAELFYTQLGDCYAAGVNDVLWQGIINNHKQVYQYSKSEMGLSNPYTYINTGVLVLDLEKIRNRFSLSQFYEKAISQKYMYQEQDLFNVIFENKIKYVDVTWNYYVPSDQNTVNGLESATANSYLDYAKKKDEIKILHFAAQTKPWYVPEIPYAEEFWQWAKLTPYYEELLSRMIDARAISYINKFNATRAIAKPVEPVKTSTRVLLEKRFPQGTFRRRIVETLIPWGSLRRKICKDIYYFFHPAKKAEIQGE